MTTLHPSPSLCNPSVWKVLMFTVGLLSVSYPVIAETEANTTETVVVSGVGADADSALRNALSNAVQQVVGVMVDADTLVDNDKLVRDQILTYSNAYVERFDKLNESSDAGLSRVTIKAAVKKGQLIEKLKAINVTLKPVSGESLFGKVVTEIQQENDAALLIRKAMEGFPARLMTVTAGEPQIVSKTSDAATVRIPLRIQVDKAAYKSFADQLALLLGKMAKSQKSVSSQCQEGAEDRVKMFLLSTYDRNWSPKPKTLREAAIYHSAVLPAGIDEVNLATSTSSRGDNLSWKTFQIDFSVGTEIARSLNKMFEMRVTLLDNSKNVIWSTVYPQDDARAKESGCFLPGRFLTGREATGPTRFQPFVCPGHLSDPEELTIPRYLSIAPVMFRQGGYFEGGYTLMLEDAVELTLGLDDLKKVSSVKCEIVSQ